jgi:dinuclear metal center YbgI/SA1388 family protein
MKLSELVKALDNFAPLDTQESWDNCGLQISYGECDVKKVMLALTPTKDIISQAKNKSCDLVLTHHPLFFVPLEMNIGIPVLSFHTCLDKADGGTTDTLIETLNLEDCSTQKIGDFLRVVKLKNEIDLEKLVKIVKEKLNLKNFRMVNNKNANSIKTVAFCAGSGSDFIHEAKESNADVLITGDLKYHTALESDIIVFDIGHFESEYPVLFKLEGFLKEMKIEVFIADEKSPFINC